MDTNHTLPQIAFHEWLSRRVERLLAMARDDEARDRFLARAVDHADLERRIRAWRQPVPARHFW
jgi:hypothetical protein